MYIVYNAKWLIINIYVYVQYYHQQHHQHYHTKISLTLSPTSEIGLHLKVLSRHNAVIPVVTASLSPLPSLLSPSSPSSIYNHT